KLNLQVVLEKVRAQEAELRELRAGRASGMPMGPGMMGPMVPGNKPQPGGMMPPGGMGMPGQGGPPGSQPGGTSLPPTGRLQHPPSVGDAQTSDPVQEAGAAVKQLREARDPEAQRRALAAWEHALEKIKQQRKGGQDPDTGNPFQAK